MIAGRNTVPGRSDPVATDPFMIHVVPEDHYHNATAFPTASFCEIRNGVQV